MLAEMIDGWQALEWKFDFPVEWMPFKQASAAFSAALHCTINPIWKDRNSAFCLESDV